MNLQQANQRVQHANRRVRTEVSKIKKLLQWAFFLVAFLWLLYQIYQSCQIKEGYRLDDMENKKNVERIGKTLGSKGGLRTSNHGGETDSYGMDMVGAADKMKHEAKDADDEGDDDSISAEDGTNSNAEENYAEEYLEYNTEEEEEESSKYKYDDKGLKRRSFGELLAKEGKTGEEVQQKKTGISIGNGDQKFIGEKVGEKNRIEVGSPINFGAVILKSVDKYWEVYRFNDEQSWAPSRRSNIQVESLLKENVSRSENFEKQSLSMFEAKAVHEGINEPMKNVEYEKVWTVNKIFWCIIIISLIVGALMEVICDDDGDDVEDLESCVTEDDRPDQCPIIGCTGQDGQFREVYGYVDAYSCRNWNKLARKILTLYADFTGNEYNPAYERADLCWPTRVIDYWIRERQIQVWDEWHVARYMDEIHVKVGPRYCRVHVNQVIIGLVDVQGSKDWTAFAKRMRDLYEREYGPHLAGGEINPNTCWPGHTVRYFGDLNEEYIWYNDEFDDEDWHSLTGHSISDAIATPVV